MHIQCSYMRGYNVTIWTSLYILAMYVLCICLIIYIAIIHVNAWQIVICTNILV